MTILIIYVHFNLNLHQIFSTKKEKEKNYIRYNDIRYQDNILTTLIDGMLVHFPVPFRS